MFDLSNYVVENVSEEEKQKHTGRMRETGTYRGYKPRKFWVRNITSIVKDRKLTSYQHIAGGVRDQIEQYNSMYSALSEVAEGSDNCEYQ